MKFSKKIPALFLLAIYLFSAAASREFCKLPLLVEHYFDHVEENHATVFLEYLVQHYYEEDGTDHDASEDNQLPFKSPENNLLSFTSLRPPTEFTSDQEIWVNISNDLSGHIESPLPAQYLDAIWQPPRA